MKSILKKALLTVLCLVMLLGVLPAQSLAASSGTCTLMQGSAQSSVTFKVKTGSRKVFKNKLVFKQTKGEYEYLPWFNGLNPKTAKGYGNFTIIVKKQGGKTETYKFNGSSKTVKLDNDSVYTITVKPKTPVMIGLRVFNRWVSYPLWNVAKVKGIVTCG